MTRAQNSFVVWKTIRSTIQHVALLGLSLWAVAWGHAPAVAAADPYYTQPQVYNSRPPTDRGYMFGHIGPTGIVAYINPGVLVTVEEMQPGSPAEGKFKKGDILLGVNGKTLKGLNPFVVMGEAITRAEATDGKLTFKVLSGEVEHEVALTIPVLGRYSKTWPVDDAKSKKIIEQAARFYAGPNDASEIDDEVQIKGHGVEGALVCLFLLSTGDDQYLPYVKKYIRGFESNLQGIGDNTWYNGYNGIAVCEYYLRTGDQDVLPVIQYYCDDAKRRQKFGCAWTHWGGDIHPRYVAGGLMNPASSQVLTTLLLAKECGADVDDATLLGCLKYFYRFAGHGSVAYGDHRAEGGLGSNGKDAMIAAAMQVAMSSSGDTTLYKAARDDLAMNNLQSYASLATGHADEGRGDAVWRGLVATYLKDQKPDEYRSMMDRLTWWFDLSRYFDGSMGIAVTQRFQDPGSGAGVMLAYTAPLKTLQISGAPRSKYAHDFKLPDRLWGRPADLAFLSIEHNPKYLAFGPEDEPHVIMNRLGNAYKKVDDNRGLSHDWVLRNIYHHRYVFRSQAAKTLFKMGHLGDLERLLSDPDPRVRRAALDGLIDWNYWFAAGRDQIKPEQFTPGMIDAIFKMVNDPDEAIYVVEGALFAIRNMPADVIHEHVKDIMPWTTSDEWWLRQASFMALQGLEKDDKLYVEVVPTLIDMMVNEYHTMPREAMNNTLAKAMKKDGPAQALILAGFERAARESLIKPDALAQEGTYNVIQSAKEAIAAKPESAVKIAQDLRARFDLIDTESLAGIVAASETKGRAGFYPLLNELDETHRSTLKDILYNDYRPELLKRLKATAGVDLGLLNTVLALTSLEKEVPGWQVLGKPEAPQRVWHYFSLDPTREDEIMPKREKKRFRDITLPDAMNGWFKPDFDDSKWNTGYAPIGTGEFGKGDEAVPNRSDWGNGEFLLARTNFTIDNPDYDLYRLCIHHNQGFHIYINGKKVSTYIWWTDPKPSYRVLDDNDVKLLKKGVNTLAVYCNGEYPADMKAKFKETFVGKLDCWIEGLRKSDLE
ncbi:MAG: hypothetical protein GC164_04670 [Phycisphaera sp.]|nr:hypothetical protein [Phycisphaera sp.]